MSNFGSPYEGRVETKETPFDAFIGRNAKEGFWWYVDSAKPENPVKLSGFEGIIVDGALSRVTGKNFPKKDKKASSNLCSPVQRILDVSIHHKQADGSWTRETKGTGEWKDFKDQLPVGKFTKVVALRLTKVFLESGSEKILKDSKLCELRLTSYQMWFFGQWLKKNNWKDTEVMYGLLKTGEDFNHTTETGTNSYSKFILESLSDEQFKVWKPTIDEDFKAVEHYVSASAPGGAPKEVAQTIPVQTGENETSEFPTADAEPPKGFNEGEDDDLPF